MDKKISVMIEIMIPALFVPPILIFENCSLIQIIVYKTTII